MFAIIPIAIKCRPNPSTATHESFITFENYTRDIKGDVKAVMIENYDEGFKILYDDVKKFISSFPLVKDGRISIEDFEFTYSVSEIVNGRFWQWNGSRLSKFKN